MTSSWRHALGLGRRLPVRRSRLPRAIRGDRRLHDRRIIGLDAARPDLDRVVTEPAHGQVARADLGAGERDAPVLIRALAVDLLAALAAQLLRPADLDQGQGRPRVKAMVQ